MPPVRLIVPEFSVREWSVQLFTSCWPFTQRRTPSSLSVKKVYVPVVDGCTLPTQRTLKVSAAIPGAGAPAPQTKSTVGSTRVADAPVKSTLS